MRIGAGWNKMCRICQNQKPDGVRIEHTEDTLVEIMNEASGKGMHSDVPADILEELQRKPRLSEIFNDIGALKAAGLSACVKKMRPGR